MMPVFGDPLKKREEFAVSLRKTKTKGLIEAKRRKWISMQNDDPDMYQGIPEFENN